MKNLRYVALVLGVMLLTGCATPFNTNNRGVVNIEGNTYRIPYQSNYAIINNDINENLNSAGIIECNVGDLQWAGKEFVKKFNTTVKREKYTDELQKAIYKKAWEHGLAGCSSPLSDYYVGVYKAKDAEKERERLIAISKTLKAFSEATQSIAGSMNQQNANTLNQMQRINYSQPQYKGTSSGYVSNTGQKYKYDLSKPVDKVLYNADPAAQIKDSVNPMIGIDRNLNQYGGGSY